MSTSRSQIAGQPFGRDAQAQWSGFVLAVLFFDVCDEIDLPRLRELLGVKPSRREPPLKHSAPEHIRFERPPVIAKSDVEIRYGSQPVSTTLKFYDYGVICVEFELPFSGPVQAWIDVACRSIMGGELESRAFELVSEQVKRAATALGHVYPQWLSEDYYIFFSDSGVLGRLGSDLLRSYPQEIAQIVSGESAPLAAPERQEILNSAMSYYETDLTVVGWNAAFIYDTPAGAHSTVQILEYTNSQLLEFRYYDEFLTRELAHVHQLLGPRTGLWDRWRLARSAGKLHSLLLDVSELAERADTSIKFVSDIFSARLYRLAAVKVGVPDYKNLVDQKLRAVNERYEFKVSRFNEARGFALEIIVVVILLIELALLLRGGH